MTLNTLKQPRALAWAIAAALAAQAAWAQAPAAPTAPAAPPATAAKATAPAAATEPPPEVSGSVSKLDWLTGCWRATTVRDGSTINEVWLAPQAGTMMGVGQTYSGSRTSGWEAMRIFDAGKSLKIWLRPGARNEMTMDLVESSAKAVGFSLTEGATTTSLRYERTNDSTLLATFRLTVGENKRGADFSFSKVDCAEMFVTTPASAAPAAATAAPPAAGNSPAAPAKQ